MASLIFNRALELWARGFVPMLVLLVAPLAATASGIGGQEKVSIGPPAPAPQCNQLRCETRPLGRLGDGDVSPHEANQSGVSAIPCLILFGSPYAVRGVVWPIVVQSLDGVAGGWPRPHVGKEQREVAAPAFADSDAAGPVVAIRRHAMVVAAVQHVAPTAVLRCAVTAMSAMPQMPRCERKAPAAPGLSTAQRNARYFDGGAAVACASVYAIGVAGRCAGCPVQRDQAAEALA